MTLSTTSPGDEREAKEREAFNQWWDSQRGEGASARMKSSPWNPTGYYEALEGWQARASLSSSTVLGADALDAARWRRLVNASEMPFPVATIADDPENDCTLIYGRTGLERLIDSCDEISDSYQGDQQ